MSTVEANHLSVSPKIGRNRVPQRLWKLKICKTVVSHTCVQEGDMRLGACTTRIVNPLDKSKCGGGGGGGRERESERKKEETCAVCRKEEAGSGIPKLVDSGRNWEKNTSLRNILQ